MSIRLDNKPEIIREYQLDFGTIKVYEDYMVSNFKEGTTVTLERAFQLIGISEIHFRGRNFGYISHRANSYAIDPTVYTYLRGLDNLKAFAIVSRKEIDMHNFGIEKLFYKKQMEFFIEYQNALNWVKKRLNRKRLKKTS